MAKKRRKSTAPSPQPEPATPETPEEPRETVVESSYGWEFHRPLVIASAVLTGLFYLVVWLVFGG